MGMQQFRGAGAAGAVSTALEGALERVASSAAPPVTAAAGFNGAGRRQTLARGWVLALDVERRLRDVRARVAAGAGSDALPRTAEEPNTAAPSARCGPRA